MKEIEKKILQSPHYYIKNLEIYKYFTSNPTCVLCQHKINKEIINIEKQNKNLIKERCSTIQDVKINTNIKNIGETRHTFDFLYWLNRLGITTNVQFTNKILIQTANDTETVDKVSIYLKFLSCFDLNSKELSFIRNMDLTQFSKAFKLFIKDKNFLYFINKLQKDPFIYEKSQKTRGLNIEIFAFSYLIKNKMDTKIMKARIEEHAYLFKPDPSYDVDLSNDFFVDKMILQLRKNTLDYNQAIFMNQVYLNISKDRSYFDLFHNILIDSINNINQCILSSFLRHVFTYRTVLFSCIQELQLIKLMISFYKNMNKSDFTVSLLLSLTKNLSDQEINLILFSELKNICLTHKKHSKILQLIEIRNITDLKDVKNLILENFESFDYLNLLFSQIKLLSTAITKQKHKIITLENCLTMFINIKVEFLDRFTLPIANIIIELLESVEIDQDFILFNLSHWDFLSDLVLHCQKDNLEIKKKKTANNQTEKYKAGLRLAKVLYNCEDKIKKTGNHGLKQLKKRGFKID